MVAIGGCGMILFAVLFVVGMIVGRSMLASGGDERTIVVLVYLAYAIILSQFGFCLSMAVWVLGMVLDR